jgi:hypothetical protein
MEWLGNGPSRIVGALTHGLIHDLRIKGPIGWRNRIDGVETRRPVVVP